MCSILGEPSDSRQVPRAICGTPASEPHRVGVEIDEDLGCLVAVGAYDFATITLTTFYCEVLGGETQPTEHLEVRWSTPAAMSHLDWVPADIPAIERIQQDLALTPSSPPAASGTPH